MQIKLFKYQHYQYLAIGTPNRPGQWALWAYYTFGSECVYLGYVIDRKVEWNQDILQGYKYEYCIRMGVRRLQERELKKVFDYGKMPIMGKRPRNPERDLDIAKKVKEGMSYRKIARYYDITVSSAYMANKRGVRLMELSTDHQFAKRSIK